MSSLNGLLVLDKPAGITSRAAVDRVLGWFPRGTRIGHTGTLDPLATGVLVLCVGTATRLAEYVQAMPKVYRATIELGATSDTDDADGTITPTPDAPEPTRDQMEQELAAFIGAIQQVPPAYSAAKITGRRAYELARKGKEVELTARMVRIDRIDILSYAYPHLEIEVHCGKGTYIRALARDLGKGLSCGAYIDALRRTQVGPFQASDGIGLDSEAARRRLLPTARAVDALPHVTLTGTEAGHLLHGQWVRAPVAVSGAEAAVFDEMGHLIAVAEIAEGMLHARKAFPS